MNHVPSNEIYLEEIDYEWVNAEKKMHNLKKARTLLQNDGKNQFHYQS